MYKSARQLDNLVVSSVGVGVVQRRAVRSSSIVIPPHADETQTKAPPRMTSSAAQGGDVAIGGRGEEGKLE